MLSPSRRMNRIQTCGTASYIFFEQKERLHLGELDSRGKQLYNICTMDPVDRWHCAKVRGERK